jgi:hypothetical protein
VDFELSPEALRRWKSKALAGDNDAANLVANHYKDVGPKDEELGWRALAARRGDCYGMYSLKHAALDQGDRRGAEHWNISLRRHACTRVKAFPGHASTNRDEPLWD